MSRSAAASLQAWAERANAHPRTTATTSGRRGNAAGVRVWPTLLPPSGYVPRATSCGAMLRSQSTSIGETNRAYAFDV